MEGVDYSFARPNPTCLHNSGKGFVVRYFSNGPSGKNINAVELANLRAAGLLVCFVFEESAGRMLSGRSAGRVDATICLSSWAALGQDGPMPPVYFALDVDPNPLSSDEIAQVGAYLDGCADVIGFNRVGLYGGMRAIQNLHSRCKYLWQTYAWSHRQWWSGNNLEQYKNGVSMCGGQVDLCRSKTADFGQWPRPFQEEDDMDATEHKLLVDTEARSEAILALLRDKTDPNVDKLLARPAYDPAAIAALAPKAQVTVVADLVRNVDADVAALPAKVAEAVKAILPPGSVDTDTIVACVVEGTKRALREGVTS